MIRPGLLSAPEAAGTVGVVGTNITGRDTVSTLLSLGYRVLLSDTRPIDDIPEESLRLCEELACERAYGDASALAQCGLVVISPGVAVGDPFLEPARQNGVEVIGEIELAFRLRPERTIVAITGTNGKSTTTALTGAMLSAAGRNAVVCGNIGSPLVRHVVEAPEDAVLVAEVSSFQLESTVHFRPHVGAILNLSDDHADRHPTLEGYLAIKARLLANQTADDFAVLNADNPHTASLLGRVGGQVLSFSAREPVAWGAYVERGEILFCSPTSREVLAETDRIMLRGRHYLENVLAACTMARVMDAPAEAIRRSLASFRPAPHTFSQVGRVDGVTVINDSKGTNVDATVRGLESLASPAVLIAGGSSKQADFGPLGRAAARHARAVVVIGQTADEIAGACREAGVNIVRHARDMNHAVRLGIELARPGDCLLLSPACASFDMFENYRHRGEVFEAAVRALPGFEPAN